jgi:hypothetical protein
LLVSFAIRVVGYFGVPLLALAALAPWLAGKLVPRRLLGFLSLCTFLPFLEVFVMTAFNWTSATWYYAFFAFFGLTALTALGIVAVYRRGFRRSGIGLGAAVLVYQLFFVFGYFTMMHGDRPRWKEAVTFLRQKAGPDVGKPGRARVYATEPGTVAFYLGVPAEHILEQRLVPPVPGQASEHAPHTEAWYVVEVSLMRYEFAPWLLEHCVPEGQFVATTGNRDRSLILYHFLPPHLAAAEPP